MNYKKNILSVLLCSVLFSGCTANSEKIPEREIETDTENALLKESNEESYSVTEAEESQDGYEIKTEGNILSLYNNGIIKAEVTVDHILEDEPKIRFEDFNFDGFNDIFISDPPTDYRHYGGECLLWDEENQKFQKTDKLDGLFGIGIETVFADNRITATYTEHHDYLKVWNCTAEFEWKNGEIIPVSLVKEDKLSNIKHIYEFDENNKPVLCSRELLYDARKEGGQDTEFYSYYRVTENSVEIMRGKEVVQTIPVNDPAGLIADYRLRKSRSNDVPLFFDDIVFSMDYDYDGYNDLCITDNVNEYGFADRFTYYHYDLQTDKFEEWDELNSTFDGGWVLTASSQHCLPPDNADGTKPLPLCFTKYTDTSAGEYSETFYYSWQNGGLVPAGSVYDYSAKSENGADFYFCSENYDADGIISGRKMKSEPFKGNELEPFGLMAAEPQNVSDSRTDPFDSFYDKKDIREDEARRSKPDNIETVITGDELKITTQYGIQIINEIKTHSTDNIYFDDFNFDGCTDFFIASDDMNIYAEGHGDYYLWDRDSNEFKYCKELAVDNAEGILAVTDSEKKTLTISDLKHGSGHTETVLKWKDGVLVPVSAVIDSEADLMGHGAVTHRRYDFDENGDALLTGISSTVTERFFKQYVVPVIDMKYSADAAEHEKYFRVTDKAVEYMEGSSILQTMNFKEIFGDEITPVTDSYMPGNKSAKYGISYARIDIDFDGTEDLCIRHDPQNGKEESRYSYYLYDKKTDKYKKWRALSASGRLYKADPVNMILYCSVISSSEDGDHITDYYMWKNDRDVLFKRSIEEHDTGLRQITFFD